MVTCIFRLETAEETMAKDHDEIPLGKAKGQRRFNCLWTRLL